MADIESVGNLYQERVGGGGGLLAVDVWVIGAEPGAADV